MKRLVADQWPGLADLAGWFHQDAKSIWGGFDNVLQVYLDSSSPISKQRALSDLTSILALDWSDGELKVLWRDLGGQYWPSRLQYREGLRIAKEAIERSGD